jgi:cytochrome b involved in lipid metabolism
MARGKTLDQQSESAKLMSPSCGPQPDEDADGVWSPTSPKVPVTGFPVTTALIPGLKEYRWEEVAQHNTGQSCWCYIGQKVYDVTTWLDAHPGGRQVLLLAAGRDCTDLFTSYHPFTDKPAKLLSKFCIGQVVTTEFPQYQPDTGFYADVRKEVGQYLKKNNLDSKDPTPGLIRLAGMMASSAFFFSLMIYSCSQAWPLVWQLAMAMAFGLAQALPLFHMMHDASHCAIGHSDTWWIWTGRFVMDWFAGASMNAWHNQHILGTVCQEAV